MIKQKVYNMIFNKILEVGHIKSPQIIEFVRETVSEKECSNSELSHIVELISQNPNISSGTQMADDVAAFMEFWWIGPDIVILEKEKTQNLYDSVDLFNQAVSIIKEKGKMNIQDLIINLGRINKNVSAIMNTLYALEYNKCGIEMNGSVYPFDSSTEFIYNGIPTIEEFIKNIPHRTSVVNLETTKSEPKYICPDCGANVRKVLNLCLTSNPPKYRYECDNKNCKYVAFHEI